MISYYMKYYLFIAAITVLLFVASCTKTTSTPISPQNSSSGSGVQVFYDPPTDRAL